MSGAMVGFTLDGSTVFAPDGELLLHAAARNGVAVPTLCHDDQLEPYGGCRMCLVEVDGSPRPVPACATRVREGMTVTTGGALDGLRRTLAEMLLAEHESVGLSPGWVQAALGLWVASMALGGYGGRTARHARALAGRLAAEGDAPSQELRSLLAQRGPLWASYVSSVLLLAIVVLMVWKPGS